MQNMHSIGEYKCKYTNELSFASFSLCVLLFCVYLHNYVINVMYMIG